MSLDVVLSTDTTEFLIAADVLDERGFAVAAAYLRNRSDVTLFDANITHNLISMAEAAGIYRHLWRPEEIDITRAGQLIEPLRLGLARLRSGPERFGKYAPSNGWGTYEGFVAWVAAYLAACEANPDALVSVSR